VRAPSRRAGPFPTLLLLAIAAPAPAPLAVAAAQEPVTVIRGATVVPVVGERIDGGDIVIRGGRIEAVGRNLTVPPGAVVLDAAGRFVYPGFIESGSQLGLTEIGSVPGGNDTRELGNYNPQDLSLTAVNPHSELIPVARVNGITTAITAAGGGMISGYAALIDLAGWTPDEMAVQPMAGLVVNYPRVIGSRFGRRGGGPENQEQVSRQVQELTDYFERGRRYLTVRRQLAERGEQPAHADLEMEALIPVLEGRVPVVFDANTAVQIGGALALADRFGLRAVIAGGTEAWALADTLAAKRVPVIVGPTTSTPRDDDPYDMIYANPGALAAAGVTIAFATGGASDVRNLPYNVALAIAYGLDPDEAIRAITINPARIWGVEDRLGSIEPGKVANLMIVSGDPLDVRTQVEHVFIRGVEVSGGDRHTELYTKFRQRP